MKTFEEMAADEFNKLLCGPVAMLDKYIRNTGHETIDGYKSQLVDLDRVCMEPIDAV